MDRYDPERRVGMVVDEWGTWYDVEPGTNPAFLYQQNTLRDAVVAAVTLNIFNSHAARVTMANIAQMINVLQAVILTEGEKMLLTPTYHVFEMYQVHQGAQLVPLELEDAAGTDGAAALPPLHCSASRRADGLHVSLVNLDPTRPADVRLLGNVQRVAGRVLTSSQMTGRNTFEAQGQVRPAAFEGAARRGDELTLRLPAKSVTVLAVE
jgi:alpha-N-arabinofuranosidase